MRTLRAWAVTMTAALVLAPASAAGQDVEQLLSQGEEAFLSGDLEKALETFGAVIEKAPERWEGYYYSGMVLQSLEQPAAAIEMYEKALEIKPDATEPLNNLAVAYLDDGQLGKALESFEKALEADPENYEAAFNIGVVLERMERFEEAAEAYVESGSLAPVDPDPYIALAEMAYAQGDVSGAGRALAEAFARAPHQVELGLKALELLSQAGQHDEALALAHELVDGLSKKPAAHVEATFRLARTLRRLGECAEALSLLGALPEEARASFSVQTEIGLCHLALGECKKAARAFDEALEAKPQDPDALLARADAWCCAGKWCRAKRAYKKFLAAAPADHPGVPAVKAKLEKGRKSCKND
jgi:Flp pilus assembly protein TadD